jgi:hypothetical protein
VKPHIYLDLNLVNSTIYFYKTDFLNRQARPFGPAAQPSVHLDPFLPSQAPPPAKVQTGKTKHSDKNETEEAWNNRICSCFGLSG